MNKYENYISLNIQRFSFKQSPYITFTNLGYDINTNKSTFRVSVSFSKSSTTYNQNAYVEGTLSGGYSGTLDRQTFNAAQGVTSLYTKSWDVTVPHNPNGTLGTITASVKVYIVSNTTATVSDDYTPPTIPRYFTNKPTLSLVSSKTTETSLTYNWATSENCSAITVNGSGSKSVTGIGGKSGTITITELSAGQTYNHSITATRSDSGLSGDTGTSNTYSNSTYNNPYVSKVSDFTMGNDVYVELYNPLNRNVTLTMTTKTGLIAYVNTSAKSYTFSGYDVSAIYNVATYDNNIVPVSVFTGTDTTIKQVNATAILPMVTTNDWYRLHPTDDKALNRNISGTFYNGIIGTTNNTISLRYRYKDSDTGDYPEQWTNITLDPDKDISGNNFKISEEITINVPYTKRATVQIELSDRYKSRIFEGQITKGNPVYYVAEDEFGVNGDLNVNGDVVINDKSITGINTGTCTLASGVTGGATAYKQNRFVFLKINVAKTLVLSQWNTLCTIPDGYRPISEFDVAVPSNTNDLMLHGRISTNGQVNVYPVSSVASAGSHQLVLGISYISNK